jgi:hypothetical protein
MPPADSASAAAHASELDLHRLVLGELPPDRQATVAQHAASCSRCTSTLAALREAQEAFDSHIHTRTVDALLARSRAWWRARRLRWLWLVPAPAALLLLATALLTRWEPAIRAKGPSGPPALELHVRRGDHLFAFTSGGPLRAGDAVRFVIRRPPELAHVLVVGVEPSGRVTVYHPLGRSASAPLPAGPGRLELPGSIVLDDGRGPERVFALFGRRPFRLAPFLDRLAALAAGGPDHLRAQAQLDAEVDGQASVVIERSSGR